MSETKLMVLLSLLGFLLWGGIMAYVLHHR